MLHHDLQELRVFLLEFGDRPQMPCSHRHLRVLKIAAAPLDRHTTRAAIYPGSCNQRPVTLSEQAVLEENFRSRVPA
jgi:hypothetical protein